MHSNKLLLLCAVCALFAFGAPVATAQTYSSLLKNANESYDKGLLPEAADLYEKAARLKENKPETMYKAAECYYLTRNYAKAVACYELSKDEFRKHELAGLRYARSLKQTQQYEPAIEAFKNFGRKYRGARKAQVIAVVQNDIKGCELAIQKGAMAADNGDQVKVLPDGINTRANDFAPLPWSSDLLYYSRYVGKKASLMRSLHDGAGWQPSDSARGLPESVTSRFGNGVFSSDGKRFYCTQCDEAPAYERAGNGLRTRCAIFGLRYENGRWSEPERLRSYINMSNHTSMHPCVASEGGRELLFFASDREGGLGGLDLYACARPLESGEFDFSFPQNLGEMINTGGDEISPFYDPRSQTLWFSSNGHISLGGLDIFKTTRGGGKWTKPENPGAPLNSSADDVFFYKTLHDKKGHAFFVSNRQVEGQKPATSDEDIFEYIPGMANSDVSYSEPERGGPDSLDAAESPMVYKVHLEIRPDFEPESPRYSGLHALGTLSAQPLPEQGMQRILLGDFTDMSKAEAAVQALRESGAFPQAFVIPLKDER
ncbi:MAG: tetratricopeptide repeat protein [Bacteroidetes bacterium]|nr:tetratricopeptide repeat protein [Bacteroidota bacterium]